MTEEEKINVKLREQFDKFLRNVERDQNGLVNEVDSVRKDFMDIIEEYAGVDGKVDRRHLRAILRKLETMNSDINSDVLDDIENTIEETTSRAKRDILITLGVLAAGVFGGKKLLDEVTKGVIKNVGKDGMTLEKRVNRFTGDLIDEVRKTVRAGVLRGKTTNQINRAVKKAVEKESWKLRRIITTESPKAYREVIAKVAQEGKNIKAVRIVDLRGRHKNHSTHECYRLAEQDMYGWGKGVYRPEDTFIYAPHPNCTAYFELILNLEGERIANER